jgi:hypothetical protein
MSYDLLFKGGTIYDGAGGNCLVGQGLLGAGGQALPVEATGGRSPLSLD